MGVDIGQWFTPPKSKTPWTAMTTGATNKNTQLERWGPVINSIASWIGNAIYPGAGSVGGAVGGAIGMQGREKGFQGTDYGWGNVMPTVEGAWSGYNAGTPWGTFGNVLSTGGSYWNGGKNPIGGYNTDYDRSKDPKGKDFDFSALGSRIGSGVGSYYGGPVGSRVGSMAGGKIGSSFSDMTTNTTKSNAVKGTSNKLTPAQSAALWRYIQNNLDSSSSPTYAAPSFREDLPPTYNLNLVDSNNMANMLRRY